MEKCLGRENINYHFQSTTVDTKSIDKLRESIKKRNEEKILYCLSVLLLAVCFILIFFALNGNILKSIYDFDS